MKTHTKRNRKLLAQRSQRRLAFEKLENRRVFAGVTFSFSGGYATVTGTSSGETIEVRDNSGNLGLQVNGSPVAIPVVSTASTIGVVIYGGEGNDTLILNNNLGAKFGFLYGQVGDDSLNGGLGLDRLYGGTGLDSFDGGAAGQDNIFSDPDDYVSGSINANGGPGPESDYLYLSAATTIILTNAMQLEMVFGSEGPDVINASAVSSSLQLYGMGGNDLITGGTAGDILFGGDGDDTLNGTSGNDTYRPGLGMDTIIATNDSISYREVQTGLTIDILGNTITGTGVNSTITGVILHVEGTSFNDTIIGNSFANNISGRGGDDTIEGRGGADRLQGDAGNDTATYANSPAGVIAYLSGSPGVGGDAAGDTIFDVENLTGSPFNDTLEGNSGSNVLTGLGGDDVLYGRLGDDTLIGMGGNDFLYGGEAGSTDKDSMDGGDGDDRFYADASDIDGSGVLLVTAGSGNDRVDPRSATAGPVNWIIPGGIETVSGTNLNDVLNASGVANGLRIFGNDGDDTITGGSGTDFLYGGNGKDVILGGAAVDRIFGEAGDDTLDGGNDGVVDILDGGLGTDTGTLNSAPADSLSNIEVIV